jgi:SagB-type dehydrogenase family enzyme
MSLEDAIGSRRTARAFASTPLSLEQLSSLLWAAQGVTEAGGFRRASPSAGALYPLDIVALTGDGSVESLRAGAYIYDSPTHSIELLLEGDHRDELAAASLSQSWMAKAPVCMVVCAEFGRLRPKYGERAERYAVLEAGHAAQNVLLQATAMGLASGIVGAFVDREIRLILRMDERISPLLVLPVGHRRA